MKLRTKLVISFVTMIMIPTILTTAFIFGIARYQIGVIEHTYGITGEEYKDFAKSIRVLGDMPEIQQFIISACIAVVLILAFTAMIMMVWIYGSIISPIHKLQEAAQNVEEGNLNFEIKPEKDDEMGRLMQAFEKMRIRLRDNAEEKLKSDRESKELISNISHDLKTPITIIQGYAKAICDGIIKEENKQQYLQTIYHKSIVLNELINAFSEYSKLEHPDFRPVKIKVDICEYAREYLAAKYNELVLGGCSLEVEIPEMIIWCQIDVQQMKRVFENLINNSVKHNKRGTALFFSMKKEADTVCISIGDNGTGIPKELTQMVFEPFVVGDESRNSRQGTGLGLAIAKKIVEAHGGVIELVKFPKEGLSTEFRIWMYTDEE